MCRDGLYHSDKPLFWLDPKYFHSLSYYLVQSFTAHFHLFVMKSRVYIHPLCPFFRNVIASYMDGDVK